jgi:hypothetical protein
VLKMVQFYLKSLIFYGQILRNNLALLFLGHFKLELLNSTSARGCR